MFAVVTGALAAFIACIYMVPFVKRFAYSWVLDFVVFVLLLVVFGIFGAVSPTPKRICIYLLG